MILRSAATVPPRVLLDAPARIHTPKRLPRAASALVRPRRLPWTRLLAVPAPYRRIPARPLPAMIFPAPATAPPTVLLLLAPLYKATPSKALGTAAVPAASVPM